jgi:NAD dependent epimerase/dehydratase family enzyme
MDEAEGELGGNEPGAPAAWRFSIEAAASWERAFFAAATPRTRKIALRSAMIMNPGKGGIFDTLLGLVRSGLGGTAASGEQFISWIHYRDFVRAIEYLTEHAEFDGPVNVCAPNPLPNREFMRMLREAWGARFGLPASNWMLAVGAALMRTETELILKSRRVVPGRLAGGGFEFQFPDWREAAKDLVLGYR